ncbi:hypothetical protein J2X55_000674 [Microbacterium sp. 1154]|uniref:hypothetical protein n=1 Tax=Microbacterium sp. 1154 TaxID=2817733 RepID=UPI00285653C1|nr:hypothetical protein [Microbacterium sp. 1154]MDR6689775.1 hypothetical protein [Microbacterium sp. 1154]
MSTDIGRDREADPISIPCDRANQMTLMHDIDPSLGETRAAIAAFVMISLGVVVAPMHLDSEASRSFAPFCAGTVFLGDPALRAAAAPPRRVLREALSDSESVHTLAIDVRNIGLGSVDWHAGFDVASHGYPSKHVSLSISTTGGATWSPPVSMDDAKNPAFCAPPMLSPGALHSFLLRVRLSGHLTHDGSSALGLSVDTTVLHNELNPTPRRPHWRWARSPARLRAGDALSD